MALTDETGGSPAEEEGTAAPRQPTRRTGLRWVVVLVLVAVAIGFLLFRGLGDATTFFYNADEAVERQDELGTSRFRMQGTVLPDTLEETVDGVAFTVTYNGVEAEVVHRGDPPELFQENIPVVIEGHWNDGTFASDRIIVKHTSEYVEDNGERLDEADDGGSGESTGEGSSQP